MPIRSNELESAPSQQTVGVFSVGKRVCHEKKQSVGFILNTSLQARDRSLTLSYNIYKCEVNRS